MREIPNKYNHIDSETKWADEWSKQGVYEWNSSTARDDLFVVDTPPPTVSGSLHVGHVFSYTHTDLIVRFKRMCGKGIMYPMGWDDNGLPTERRVQNKFNIRCNPHLPYDASWQPVLSTSATQGAKEVSRRNFIEACAHVTSDDEAAFEYLWKRLGLSVDWKQTYATIDEHCRRVSQFSFLDLVKRGLAYSAESPTMWDVGYQTALAQADLEDRNEVGAFHDIAFGIEGGGEFVISTTRPELLVSCIAVAAHPSDERYQNVFGKYAITPIFKARVPIVPAQHADPEKGTGILMICTFGDIFDVEWWKQSSLPLKQVLGRDGKFLDVDFSSGVFESIDPKKAQEAYNEIKGKTVRDARKSVVKLLRAEGSAVESSVVDGLGSALRGEPRPVEHPVKYYEKGEEPIEFVTTRQWFIKLLDHKDALREQGRKISWHPDHMRVRYDHWVEGLNHDWCISRQRFFGVPFPVWYRVNEDGSYDYQNPMYASEDMLPVDPLSAPPAGFDESQRGVPGGFVGDPDVMDTWATSSLTPQIVSHWGKDAERHKKLFPMDIRPQSHEIIRTWAFYTIAKAWMHSNDIPWRHVVISGWILDPDRKKMSKSRGNVVTPQHLLEQYSSDAVRYWAARARLGVDTAYDEKVFKSGQKLATKLFNASRFVLMQIQAFNQQIPSEHAVDLQDMSNICCELDRAFVARMREAIASATSAFERFDYASALQSVETVFWYFCDHYVELIKGRAYSSVSGAASDVPVGVDNVSVGNDSNAFKERRSAVMTLEWSLGAFVRLFAPFLPFVTEEVWSWHFSDKNYGNENNSSENISSVHCAKWPSVDEVNNVTEPFDVGVLDLVVEIVEGVRQAKSEQQKTLKWPVDELVIVSSEDKLEALKAVVGDIQRTAKVSEDGVLMSVGAVKTGRAVDVQVTLATEMQMQV